jgi:hypothetical protein
MVKAVRQARDLLEIPVAEMPVVGIPIAEMPVVGMPVAEMLVVGIPIAEMPVVGILAEEMLGRRAPMRTEKRAKKSRRSSSRPIRHTCYKVRAKKEWFSAHGRPLSICSPSGNNLHRSRWKPCWASISNTPD